MNFPGKDFDEIEETCALREAHRQRLRMDQESAEPTPFSRLAKLTNLSMQRTNQLYLGAIKKVKDAISSAPLDEN